MGMRVKGTEVSYTLCSVQFGNLEFSFVQLCADSVHSGVLGHGYYYETRSRVLKRKVFGLTRGVHRPQSLCSHLKLCLDSVHSGTLGCGRYEEVRFDSLKTKALVFLGCPGHKARVSISM
jgi:hypothetical protein